MINNFLQVKDLKEQIGTQGRPILYCTYCGGEYSANSSDYFNLDPNDFLTCCGQALRLVGRKIVYTAIER